VGKPPLKKNWDVSQLTPEQLQDITNCIVSHEINKEIAESEDISEMNLNGIWISLIAGAASMWLGIKMFFAWFWPF